jgi:MFS family permease
MSSNPRFFARTFRAFRYRDFRLMWMGACASTIGTFVQQFAQSWLVYDLTKDPFYLGLDLFLGQLPIMMFSLFGGVFADRLDRRKMLLTSQYIQMFSAFLLTLLFVLHVVKVWHILTLSFIVGIGQSFGGPAYSALLPTLVGPEDLSNAIAMNSIQFNIARILGPTIGGLAYATLGATWCFGLNGVSFLAVIASLMMIHVKFVPSKSTESVLNSMKEGIRFIRHRDGMSALVVLAGNLHTSLGLFGSGIDMWRTGRGRVGEAKGAGTSHAADPHFFRSGHIGLCAIQVASSLLHSDVFGWRYDHGFRLVYAFTRSAHYDGCNARKGNECL